MIWMLVSSAQIHDVLYGDLSQAAQGDFCEAFLWLGPWFSSTFFPNVLCSRRHDKWLYRLGTSRADERDHSSHMYGEVYV